GYTCVAEHWCTNHGSEPSTVTVRARTSTLSAGGDELEVAGIVVHQDFDKFILLNDIALIKLKIPVQFGETLLPIGLPEKEDYNPDDGTTCFVTGWKYTPRIARRYRLTNKESSIYKNINDSSALIHNVAVSKKGTRDTTTKEERWTQQRNLFFLSLFPVGRAQESEKQFNNEEKLKCETVKSYNC
ncbi:Trypsin-4, partial [Melipona quadrifasciata]